MRKWLNRIFKRLRGKRSGTSHAYSVSGWVRGADGIFRNGQSVIFQRGRAWFRDDTGGYQEAEQYPSLRAAIKQERKDPEPGPDTLFEDTRLSYEPPLAEPDGKR